MGAISDKLIFDKVVFVENKALHPMHEWVNTLCCHEVAIDYDECTKNP